MGFVDKLVLDGKRKRMEEELKEEKLPLFIWGSGNLAELVRKYLRIHEIQAAGFFEWPRVRHDTFHGNKVYSMEEIEEGNSRYNVIVAHSHYSMAAELLTHASNINKIYYLFSFDYCGDNCNTYFECDTVRSLIQPLEMIYDRFSDNKSRENLAAFLNTKMTGDVQYIFDAFEGEMSFFENDVYALSKTECYWNIGGGRGETITEFLKNTGNRFKQIVTLEPDLESYRFLRRYIETLPFDNQIFAYLCAAWDKQEKVSFFHDDDVTESGGIAEGEENRVLVDGIPLDKLFLEREDIQAPTFITANYFQGIIEMLAGSKYILKRYAPALAIVVGHNDEYGLVRITEAILNANVEYKFYLRFHQALATTLVLYAVAE